MTDRRSISSDDYQNATTGEATVGMKGKVKELQQVTSSGTKSQDKRMEKALSALNTAAQELAGSKSTEGKLEKK